jgi:hypothetical protein
VVNFYRTQVGSAYASGRHVVKHCVSPIEQNYSPEHFLIKFPTNDEYYEGVLMPILAGIKNKQLRSFASKSARLPASPLVCQQVRSFASKSARLPASPLVCQQVRSFASKSARLPASLLVCKPVRSFIIKSALLQEAPILHKSLPSSPTQTSLKTVALLSSESCFM